MSNEPEIRSRVRNARLACALSATVLVAVALSAGAQHRSDRARIARLEARNAALSQSLADRARATALLAEQQSRSLGWRLADAEHTADAHEAEARKLREENAALRALNQSLYQRVRAFERAAPPRVAPPPPQQTAAPQWFYGAQ